MRSCQPFARSKLPQSRSFEAPSGTTDETSIRPSEKEPPDRRTDVPEDAFLVKTWIMPAKAETPYRVPCGPLTISMWSMSSMLIWESEGLKGPPMGIPSTMKSSASNSFRPHRPTLG